MLSTKSILYLDQHEERLTEKFRVPGAPVSGGFATSFTCEATQAAVVVPAGNVTYLKAYPSKPYRSWMDENVSKIIKLPKADDEIIGKKGLWIITETYKAKQKAIAVLESKGSSIGYSIDVNVANIATASPSASWWSSKESDFGWFKSENVCARLRSRDP